MKNFKFLFIFCLFFVSEKIIYAASFTAQGAIQVANYHEEVENPCNKIRSLDDMDDDVLIFRNFSNHPNFSRGHCSLQTSQCYLSVYGSAKDRQIKNRCDIKRDKENFSRFVKRPFFSWFYRTDPTETVPTTIQYVAYVAKDKRFSDLINECMKNFAEICDKFEAQDQTIRLGTASKLFLKSCTSKFFGKELKKDQELDLDSMVEEALIFNNNSLSCVVALRIILSCSAKIYLDKYCTDRSDKQKMIDDIFIKKSLTEGSTMLPIDLLNLQATYLKPVARNLLRYQAGVSEGSFDLN